MAWDFDTHCESPRKIVVMEENGRELKLTSPNDCIEKVQVDGGLLPADAQPKKCDYVAVVRGEKLLCYVEIKGQKVYEAAKQLISTFDVLDRDLADHFFNGEIKVRIGFAIVSSVPKAGTDLQRAKMLIGKLKPQMKFRCETGRRCYPVAYLVQG